jgi:hypothetical protein
MRKKSVTNFIYYYFIWGRLGGLFLFHNFLSTYEYLVPVLHVEEAWIKTFSKNLKKRRQQRKKPKMGFGQESTPDTAISKAITIARRRRKRRSNNNNKSHTYMLQINENDYT